MKNYAIYSLFLLIILVSCQNLDSKQIEIQMKADLNGLVPYLSEKDLTKVSYYNLQKGYMISGTGKLQPIDFGTFGEDGVLHFNDGTTINIGFAERTKSTRNPQYASYRLVKSNPFKSFRGIQSNVLTPQYSPELVGIDQLNEAAYDYIGAERDPSSICGPSPYSPCLPNSTTTGPGFSFEGGIVMNSSHNAAPYVSIGGTFVGLNWPYALYQSGSEYMLRLYIPTDNNIEFRFTNVAYNLSYSWVFTVPGARINGNNMIYRRNTALLADPVIAKSLDNR